MHVAFVIDSLFSGGAQRQAVELACALDREGSTRTSFLVYRHEDFFAPRLREHGIEIEVVPKLHKLDPLFPLRLRRAILRRSVDVVHAFLLDPCVWTAAALRTVPKQVRPAFVVSERCSLIASSRSIALRQRFAYPMADAVASNAWSVASEITTRLGIADSRVHTIPNGIDLESWDAALETPPAIEFDATRFHLGLVGRLEPEKNHVHLLRALASLEPRILERLKVWFIGSEDAEAACRPPIEREVASLRLTEVVEFVGPQRDIAPIIGGLDALVLPSLREAFPNTVLEAMASRVPVLASAVGDVPNLVEPGRSGFLVAPDDEAGLTDRIRELVEMPGYARTEMGARGRKIVEERFQIAAIAGYYRELYAAVTNAPASSQTNE